MRRCAECVAYEVKIPYHASWAEVQIAPVLSSGTRDFQIAAVPSIDRNVFSVLEQFLPERVASGENESVPKSVSVLCHPYQMRTLAQRANDQFANLFVRTLEGARQAIGHIIVSVGFPSAYFQKHPFTYDIRATY